MAESDAWSSRDAPHGRNPPERDISVGIGPAAGSSPLRRFSHEAMATVFEVFTPHPDRAYAAQAAAAQAAFDLVDLLEQELSRFIPNSDIARVNRLAAGQAARVGPSAFECVTIARHVFDLTGGAFDISLGTGLSSLELRDGCEVLAAASGVRLDLGAIGKGYAVDRMAELLEEWAIGPALVHGGFSSVLALDPPEGADAWPLTLSDPLDPSRVLVRLPARQQAIAASGVRKGDHILDPRSREPVRGRVAAWCALNRPERPAESVPRETARIAPAAVADALTTAFMVMEAGEIETLCARNPGLEAWVLLAGSAGAENERRLLHFGGDRG